MELFAKLIDPVFVVSVLSAIAAFATLVGLTYPYFYGGRLDNRMKYVASEREKLRQKRLAELAQTAKQGSLRGQTKPIARQVVDLLKLRQAFDLSEISERLKMAGYRGQGPATTYLFLRVAVPIVAMLATLFYVFILMQSDTAPLVKIAISIGAGYVGFFLPELFLKNLISRRQQAIAQVFPDALDLLLICVQSGMSVEAAFSKVSEESSDKSIELAEELSLVTAELSYLQNRKQAFENFGKRTGIDSVKAVSTALIQAERYGTPVSQALRVLAKESREERMAAAEKKAAALPPKLTVPMILFFLPVLFVVILGPSIMQVMTTFN